MVHVVQAGPGGEREGLGAYIASALSTEAEAGWLEAS